MAVARLRGLSPCPSENGDADEDYFVSHAKNSSGGCHPRVLQSIIPSCSSLADCPLHARWRKCSATQQAAF